MDRFEKHALDIIKRGDEILNQKRKRSRIIRNTAFSLSGICAVFIIGFGIVHNKELFESVRKPIPDKVIVNEITTETTAYTTTASDSDTAIVTTAEVNTTNAVTAVTTTKTGTVTEPLTSEYSAVTTTVNADVHNSAETQTGNTQNTVSYTKKDTVITTNSYTTTAVAATAPQAITTNATTTEDKISCTVSLSTQTTANLPTTAVTAVSTSELTVKTTAVQTKPTTAVLTTDIQTQPTTTAVVTTTPTSLPDNPYAESESRFEWQGINFIKTPYYSEKDNAFYYLGSIGDNQIYSYGHYNTYVVVLMLSDDKYVICVNETYYEDFMKEYEEV